MLLFKPEHVGPILEGRKTETRRVWSKWRCNVGSIHLAKTRMLSPEHFARLRILARWEQHLGDITDEGARREGYNSREEYLRKFAEINAKSLRKSSFITDPIERIHVKVISFEVMR